MAISHHDREEETLIAYFQQMLADVDDEEFSGELQATSGGMEAAPIAREADQVANNQQVMDSANAAIASAHTATSTQNPVAGMEHLTTQEMVAHELSIADESEVVDNPLAYELQPQVQLRKEPLDAREYALPENTDHLQRLLASITPDAKVETQVAEAVAEPVVEAQVAEAVAEPVVDTKVAEVVAEPVVETQVAAPQIQTVAKVVEVKAAPATVAAPTKQVIKTHEQMVQERMDAKLRAINSAWKNVDLGQQFQALFFLAQGVRFAVPLIDLGGIFECEKITQLFGKPSWFMGITDVRGAKINIVDTLRWVMPEIGESPDKYPYLIALGTSPWAIGCDVLEGNRSLSADQVKWREIPGSRPWLAGIVTSDKCALLHVNALISLFDAGANIEDLVRGFEDEQKSGNKQ